MNGYQGGRLKKSSVALIAGQNIGTSYESQNGNKRVNSMVLKVIGYILSIIFGIELIYIFSGMAFFKHSILDVIWHLVYAAILFGVGIWLINRKPKGGEKK
jgi:high-affinity Fe2+/Pb2+ permease